MKNITLSADEKLIEAARERVRAEHTTLNEQFRRWLADYVQPRTASGRGDGGYPGIARQTPLGRKLTRDEMNER